MMKLKTQSNSISELISISTGTKVEWKLNFFLILKNKLINCAQVCPCE